MGTGSGGGFLTGKATEDREGLAHRGGGRGVTSFQAQLVSPAGSEHQRDSFYLVQINKGTGTRGFRCLTLQGELLLKQTVPNK